MFSSMILKRTQMKETVNVCLIELVFFLFQKLLTQRFIEIYKKLKFKNWNKKLVFLKERVVFSKKLTYINKRCKSGRKLTKSRKFTRFDIKLPAHNAVRFDNWVVSQKLNPS